MLLNRNNNSKANNLNWLIYPVIIAVICVTIFGARERIKLALLDYIKIDKNQINQIIAEYIDQHPREIIKSLEKMQQTEYEEMLKQAQAKIAEKKDELAGKNSEFITFEGNENGDAIVTAFFDYRCGYCKSTNKMLSQLVKEDSKLKIVFKELPVLGAASQKLAKLALAVALTNKDKYVTFHNQLMDSQNTDDKSVEAILKANGLDVEKINKIANDEKTSKELLNISNLANALTIRGTPAFIVGDELIPGAIPMNKLKEKIAALRDNSKVKKENKDDAKK